MKEACKRTMIGKACTKCTDAAVNTKLPHRWCGKTKTQIYPHISLLQLFFFTVTAYKCALGGWIQIETAPVTTSAFRTKTLCKCYSCTEFYAHIGQEGSLIGWPVKRVGREMIPLSVPVIPAYIHMLPGYCSKIQTLFKLHRRHGAALHKYPV